MIVGRRDPRQARFLTSASLRWVVRQRAWTPYYLKRYWRFAIFKLRHPRVVTQGFVFLGKHIEIEVAKGYAQLVLGKWVHIGDGNKLRVHNGSIRIGDKTVLGSENVINAHLDIEIGPATLVSDWVYICDFDHVMRELDRPIKDQGLLCSPVRIGGGCWIGTKVTVLRGTTVGDGSVLAAHTVARGLVPAGSVVGGAPCSVLKNRGDIYSDPAQVERRRYLAMTAVEQKDVIDGEL